MASISEEFSEHSDYAHPSTELSNRDVRLNQSYFSTTHTKGKSSNVSVKYALGDREEKLLLVVGERIVKRV